MNEKHLLFDFPLVIFELCFGFDFLPYDIQ